MGTPLTRESQRRSEQSCHGTYSWLQDMVDEVLPKSELRCYVYMYVLDWKLLTPTSRFSWLLPRLGIYPTFHQAFPLRLLPIYKHMLSLSLSLSEREKKSVNIHICVYMHTYTFMCENLAGTWLLACCLPHQNMRSLTSEIIFAFLHISGCLAWPLEHSTCLVCAWWPNFTLHG